MFVRSFLGGNRVSPAEGKRGRRRILFFSPFFAGETLGQFLGRRRGTKATQSRPIRKRGRRRAETLFLSRSLPPRRRRLSSSSSSSSSSCYLYALNALPENREKRGGTEQKKIRGMKRGGGGRRLLFLHCSVSYILCGNGAEGVRGRKKTIRE